MTTGKNYSISPLELTKRGFFIFPCRGKHPMRGMHWAKDSTRDITIIEQWIKLYPDCNWSVDCGKSGFIILDDDRGKVPEAIESLNSLELEYGHLPKTFTVKTPSGGYHYYFVGKGRNSASTKLGKGLDTRGDGGYVVAPGTTGYCITEDEPLELAPKWFIDLIGEEADDPIKRATPITELNSPDSIRRAIHLLQAAPPSIALAGGNNNAYEVACKVKDLGVSEDMCLTLMMNNWNARCDPPWEESELVAPLSHAYQYGRNEIGSRSVEGVFEEVTIETPPVSKLFIEANELLSRELVIHYMVQGMIETPTTGLIFGDSGAGKSFVAIDMALGVACGTEWMGNFAKQGVVVYFAGEGRAGVQRRIAAWCKYHNLVVPPNHLWVSERRVEFTQKVMEGVSDEIKAIQDHTGLPIAFGVVDTLARHISPTADENSAKDVGNFINAVDWLRDKHSCVMAVIHHTGKMNKEFSRGSSAIKGALDWEFKVDYKNDYHAVVFKKQKDGEVPKPFGFTMEEIVLGRDLATGRDITSLVPVKSAEYDPTYGKKDMVSNKTVFALQILQTLQSLSGKVTTTRGEWQEELEKQWPKQSKETIRTFLSGACQDLEREGLITRINLENGKNASYRLNVGGSDD